MGFRAALNVDGYIERLGLDLDTDAARPAVEVERPVFAPLLRGRPEQAVASAETALEPSPTTRWDVNGYYRLHGVCWPYKASKAVLRRGHHERGLLGDPRGTYALTVLTNPVTRRAYDAVPLGEVYLADPWVQQMLKGKAAAGASAASAASGEVITPADVLREAGLDLGPGPGSDHPGNTGETADQDPGSTPGETPSRGGSTVVEPWRWAFYQYRSSCDDTDRLGRWQEMLVQAFAVAGRRRRFAVGFVGRQAHQWVAGEAQGALVVFLNDHVEPSPELAAQVARSLDERGA